MQRAISLEQSQRMKTRLAAKDDATAWSALRIALWPEGGADRLRDEAAASLAGKSPETMLAAVFLAEASDGAILGMLELSLRLYADGCESSPVPYIEGWYVAEAYRGRGIGAALVKAAEEWAVQRGHSEMASDALLENAISARAHKALGFAEVERAIRFRKVVKP